MAEEHKHLRPIRSYVLRKGRITTGQNRGLEQGWPQFGLTTSDGTINPQTLFNNDHPVILEIGFGMGDSLLQMAKTHLDNNYIGIEVHRPGVGALLKQMLDEQIDNIRIYQEDALEVLTHCIPDKILAGVQLYFPDPWHKKKHHKRRMVQLPFAALVHAKLKPGGYFHLATDWQDYAEHMMAVMSQAPGFENAYGTRQFAGAAQPNNRPLTKFEARGKRLGHTVWDLLFLTPVGFGSN